MHASLYVCAYLAASSLTIPLRVAAIDMWSFGCILAELFSGYPIFPGENEVEQLACHMEILGLPPRSMLESGTLDVLCKPRVLSHASSRLQI